MPQKINCSNCDQPFHGLTPCSLPAPRSVIDKEAAPDLYAALLQITTLFQYGEADYRTLSCREAVDAARAALAKARGESQDAR